MHTYYGLTTPGYSLACTLHSTLLLPPHGSQRHPLAAAPSSVLKSSAQGHEFGPVHPIACCRLVGAAPYLQWLCRLICMMLHAHTGVVCMPSQGLFWLPACTQGLCRGAKKVPFSMKVPQEACLQLLSVLPVTTCDARWMPHSCAVMHTMTAAHRGGCQPARCPSVHGRLDTAYRPSPAGHHKYPDVRSEHVAHHLLSHNTVNHRSVYVTYITYVKVLCAGPQYLRDVRCVSIQTQKQCSTTVLRHPSARHVTHTSPCGAAAARAPAAAICSHHTRCLQFHSCSVGRTFLHTGDPRLQPDAWRHASRTEISLRASSSAQCGLHKAYIPYELHGTAKARDSLVLLQPPPPLFRHGARCTRGRAF